MRCKFCSAPLPKKGLVCNYCGQRNPLNLNHLSKIDIEEEKSEYNCPICSVTLDNINIGLKAKTLVQRCHTCDGVFICEDVLEQLIQKKSVIRENIDMQILRFVQDNPRQLQEHIISYRKCPVCEKTMQRLNYRAISGVIVDRCLRHGIWLDGGELRQIFEWKEAGYKANTITPVPNSAQKKHETFAYSKDASYDPIGKFFDWLQGV